MTERVDQLPRPYQLLAQLADGADFVRTDLDRRHGRDMLALIQELAVELWRAGQDEHRAGMGTIDSDYDAPLYCPKIHPDELTRMIGVPTVPPSDPAKDLGRGRSIR